MTKEITTTDAPAKWKYEILITENKVCEACLLVLHVGKNQQKNEKTQELLDKTKEYLANVKDGLAKKTSALDAKTEELKALKAVCDGSGSIQQQLQQHKLDQEKPLEEGDYGTASIATEGKFDGVGGHKKSGSGKVTKPKRVSKDRDR